MNSNKVQEGLGTKYKYKKSEIENVCNNKSIMQQIMYYLHTTATVRFVQDAFRILKITSNIMILNSFSTQ